MKKMRGIAFFCVLFLFVQTIGAVESSPNGLINFDSERGLFLFKKNSNVNTLKLLEHFTTQKTVTYCGIASAVMLLNAIGVTPPIDLQHSQPDAYYFNQENVFNDAVKKIITPEAVSKTGISLNQLNQVIQSYGLKTRLFFSNEMDLGRFRTLLKNAIRDKKFVIVNFSRTDLHQKGGGHHAPIAAYDEKTDRFLLLDVARYKYDSYWVKTTDLWKATHTKADDAYRGFILVRHHDINHRITTTAATAPTASAISPAGIA